MSKQDALAEAIIQDVIGFIMQDNEIELELAMKQFYTSCIFEKLKDYETGLYFEGSAYVYELYKDELLK